MENRGRDLSPETKKRSVSFSLCMAKGNCIHQGFVTALLWKRHNCMALDLRWRWLDDQVLAQTVGSPRPQDFPPQTTFPGPTRLQKSFLQILWKWKWSPGMLTWILESMCKRKQIPCTWEGGRNEVWHAPPANDVQFYAQSVVQYLGQNFEAYFLDSRTDMLRNPKYWERTT